MQNTEIDVRNWVFMFRKLIKNKNKKRFLFNYSPIHFELNKIKPKHTLYESIAGAVAAAAAARQADNVSHLFASHN